MVWGRGGFCVSVQDNSMGLLFKGTSLNYRTIRVENGGKSESSRINTLNPEVTQDSVFKLS